MAWFGSKSGSSGSIPAASSVHKQKHKQIESLRDLVPNVTEIKRDELYQVIFDVQGNPITLDIKLPPSFPLTDHSPIVTVSPPMRHPWINEHMIVDGSPLVKNFNIHSSLGRAVQQVIKELTDHPPEMLTLPPAHPLSPIASSMFYVSPGIGGPFMFSSVPHTVANERVGNLDDVPTRRPAPPPPSAGLRSHRQVYKPPPIPDKLDDVRGMSTEELEKYLNDDEGPVLVDQYVSQMEVIKKLHQDRDNLFADNETQAGINLRHEPDMQEAWTHLQDNFLQMQALQSDHEKLLNKQKQLTEQYQRRNVVTKLKTLTQEAETESEIVAEDFLDKKLPLTEFLQKYKQQRILHHMRKSKLEKLNYSSTSYS